MMTPLYKALLDYINSDFSRLHMPGHKGQDIYRLNNLWRFDVTEINGLDNLLYSHGAIKQTEDLYKKIYNSNQTLISTQGSTLGIQIMLTAALLATNRKSNKIIIDRNIHVAAINTLALLDLDPIWIFADQVIDDFLPGLISPENIENIILKNPEAKIVFVTSPNYFGQVLDLKSIYEVCLKYDKFLLVDNAHGAHLKFISDKMHPTDCGCSCCCDSLHKSLPTLTGAALVHCLDDRLTFFLKKAQRLYSSTSPSYLIMLSIDRLLEYINQYLISDYYKLLPKINNLKSLAKNLDFDILNENMDPLKFVIGPGKFNCNGNEIVKVFRDFKIEIEYCNEYWVLLMFSMQSQDKDFNRIEAALKYMSKFFNKLNKIDKKHDYLKENTSLFLKKAMSIRDAVLSNSHKIKTIDANNKIIAESVITSPPCVPILVPGEIVSRETIDLLLDKNIDFLNVIY